MKHRIVPLILLGLLYSCANNSKTAVPIHAADFSLMDTDSVKYTLEDYRDKIVLIHFWADWCPFCEQEMEAIEPLYQKYRSQGLVILAINVRQDRATAQAFIDRLKVSYPVLLDGEGKVTRDYGVAGLPTTFVIDREGRLATRILGESTPEVFERIIGGLL